MDSPALEVFDPATVESPGAGPEAELCGTAAAALFEAFAEVVDEGVRVLRSEPSTSPTPPIGADEVHIAFRFTCGRADAPRYACLLLPLTTAVSGACCRMMVPLEQVAVICASGQLDATVKDAILEIGNTLADALGKAFAAAGREDSVGFHGCQGTREDTMPWIPANNPAGWRILRGHGAWDGRGEFEFLLGLPAD